MNTKSFLADVLIRKYSGQDIPVENSEALFFTIAQELIENNVCVISWTEGECTRFDILFSIPPHSIGRLTGGARAGGSHLFVNILSHSGGRPFLMDSETLYMSKVAENLGFCPKVDSEEMRKLTELVNGVKKNYLMLKHKGKERKGR